MMACPNCGSDRTSARHTTATRSVLNRCLDCLQHYVEPRPRLTARDWIQRARATPEEVAACERAAELAQRIREHEGSAKWGVGGNGNRRWHGGSPEEMIDALTPDWRRRVALLRVVLAIYDERYGSEEAA